MSARKAFLDLVKKTAKSVRNQRYFVKRGVINWASFDFERNQFAISILCDDMSFLKQSGIQDMKFSLEIATTIPDKLSTPEIDDGILDTMIDDAESIFRTVLSQTDTLGDSITLQVDTESARVIEFHDSGLGVQGIVITTIVKY